MYNKRTRKHKIVIRRRVIGILSTIFCFIGFGIVIGTAGASDCDMIGMREIIIRGIIGTMIFSIGCFGAWLLDETK